MKIPLSDWPTIIVERSSLLLSKTKSYWANISTADSSIISFSTSCSSSILLMLTT